MRTIVAIATSLWKRPSPPTTSVLPAKPVKRVEDRLDEVLEVVRLLEHRDLLAQAGRARSLVGEGAGRDGQDVAHVGWGGARVSARRQRKVSPILRPHVGAGLRQAVRDLRRRRDRLGGGAQRPARRRRPVARPRGRGVLHLRSGAALSHQRAHRLRAPRRAHRPRLLRADDRRAAARLRDLALRARRALRRRRRAPSVRAITASFGNAVQIGIPLAAALYGESGLALHVTLVSLHALILLTILTALVELDLAHARRRGERAAAISSPRWRRRRATRSSTRSCCRCSPAWPGMSRGSRCPPFADEILATLGQAVVPLCLVLIGVSLAHYGVRGALRSAALLSVVKLVVQPLAVLAFARFVLGLDRRAARDRRDDGGGAGRQQRAHLLAALRDAAGRDEHGDRRLDARLRRHARRSGWQCCTRSARRLGAARIWRAAAPLAILRLSQILGLTHGVGPLVESVRRKSRPAPGGVDGPEGAASLARRRRRCRCATADRSCRRPPPRPRRRVADAEAAAPVDVPLSDPQRIELLPLDRRRASRSQARPACRTSSSST